MTQIKKYREAMTGLEDRIKDHGLHIEVRWEAACTWAAEIWNYMYEHKVTKADAVFSLCSDSGTLLNNCSFCEIIKVTLGRGCKDCVLKSCDGEHTPYVRYFKAYCEGLDPINEKVFNSAVFEIAETACDYEEGQ